MRKARPTEFFYQGGTFHRGLFHLLRDGEITKTELLLLLVIDSMVQYGSHGCFASNEYLAEAIGSNPSHVSHCIHRLAEPKLKLLKINHKDGRHLEADWSRLTSEREQLCEIRKPTLRKFAT